MLHVLLSLLDYERNDHRWYHGQCHLQGYVEFHGDFSPIRVLRCLIYWKRCDLCFELDVFVDCLENSFLRGNTNNEVLSTNSEFRSILFSANFRLVNPATALAEAGHVCVAWGETGIAYNGTKGIEP